VEGCRSGGEGEIYTFLGLNGAGKTTTMRMLLGMIKPSRGRGRAWLGVASGRGAGSPGRGWADLVETSTPLSELTVRENLEVARRCIQYR